MATLGLMGLLWAVKVEVHTASYTGTTGTTVSSENTGSHQRLQRDYWNYCGQ